ncbi:alpha-N-arabinofuranosidase [Kribbella sp. NBC_01505]|uniref:alpha-N-arabinofuranosidase n=1 Tax=Kribbella sp. NBC_01505 TaxID=2903580 RepID=UPI00386DACAE
MTSTRAVVDLDLPGARISRHLYGHFAEHLGRCIYGGFWVGEDSPIPNVRGIRTDVVEALRALQIPNLRWPGGCFADEYHWRDGVGPRDERPTMVNTHWGNVVEDNSFGTHEFLDLCELLGADPYISGNVGSGSVREMREWVDYLTGVGESPMTNLRRANGREEPWRVPFWGIGNESWGCGGNMRAEAYADLARQYATYCRDHGDNKLYRVATGANADDYNWTETLMRTIGGCGKGPLQAISLHYYTIAGDWEDKGHATDFSLDEYYATLAKAGKIDELLRRHSTVMDVFDPCGKVGLVLDEWGTWWNVAEGTNPGFLYQQNTIRDALVASLHFDTFHRHAARLTMANIAQTVNVLQAMILTDPDTGALVRTPTYHVFEMNTGHHDADSLAVHLLDAPSRNEIPLISASASTKDDTALISLSNLDAESAQSIILDLRGRDIANYTARILTAPSPQAHNTPTGPETVAPQPFTDLSNHPRGLALTIPPHSYLTITLTLA